MQPGMSDDHPGTAWDAKVLLTGSELPSCRFVADFPVFGKVEILHRHCYTISHGGSYTALSYGAKLVFLVVRTRCGARYTVHRWKASMTSGITKHNPSWREALSQQVKQVAGCITLLPRPISIAECVTSLQSASKGEWKVFVGTSNEGYKIWLHLYPQHQRAVVRTFVMIIKRIISFASTLILGTFINIPIRTHTHTPHTYRCGMNCT